MGPQADRKRARKRNRQGARGLEKELERETGIEPATSSLGSLRSTPELLPLPRNDEGSKIHRLHLRTWFKIRELSLSVNP